MGSEMMVLGYNKQENMKSNNFTQTCNRFSQFLKERRSLGHLDAAFNNKSFGSSTTSELDLKGGKEVVSGVKNNKNNNNATAINLLSKNMEKERMSLELFPLTNSRAKAGVEDSTNDMADSRELPISKEESKNNTTSSSSPSMTIFYGGKVLVFNELPEDKAQEIMSLATRGTTKSCGSKAEAETKTPHHSINTQGTHCLTVQGVLPEGASSLSDFPIARRVSLHRFIEKRKHRIAASAPYQVQVQNKAVAKEDANSLPCNSDLKLELKL